jgi:hypothetical protein
MLHKGRDKRNEVRVVLLGQICLPSHRTRCIVCIFSGYSLKKEQRKVKAVLSSGKKKKAIFKT